MFDEKESDEKIIAVCQTDPNMNGYKDISELPKHYFDEITHFFNVYKTLEGKETVVTEVLGREQAEQIIHLSYELFLSLTKMILALSTSAWEDF